MTPAEYVAEIALPTVREFFDDPGDQRKGYLAAMVTHHLRDYIMRANVPIGASRSKRDIEFVAIDTSMKGRHAAEYEVVDGVCNGTKHCGRDSGAHHFMPGDEKRLEAFGFGPGYAGLDEGRWGSPGLQIQHAGSSYFMDTCIKTVLRDFQAEYPQHLNGVALDF